MKRVMYSLRYLLLLVTFACSLSVFAQERSQVHNIFLRNTTLNPQANARQWLDSMSHIMAGKEPILALLHFNALPTQAERALLLQNGITLTDYLPDNTYAAIIQPGFNEGTVLSLPVHSIINMRPEWKAGEYLWKQTTGNGSIEILVSFYPGIDASMIKQFVATTGGQILPGLMERYGAYKVRVAAERVRSIAAWYGVRNISHVSADIPLDIQSRAAVKGNVSSGAGTQGNYGLLGDSVTIGVGDNTSGIFHYDTKDRVINFNPAALTRHGVHVNGIAGGAGNVDPVAVSTTPHVTLVDHFFSELLSATGDMYHDFNMTIGNNSYTLVQRNCDYAGTYDAYSAFLDTLALEYPFVQHVFASGNDGFILCAPYPLGFGTTQGGYQPSKNALVVGNIGNNYRVSFDESRGPVRDGRMKPDMVGIGSEIYSSIEYSAYLFSSGTSMSSPQVASGMAVLTQQYKRTHSGSQPRADLLKTIMMNGAMDLGNPGPDYTYGFGVMDLYRSLQILNNNNYTTNNIAAGDSQSFTITVPANTGLLKVMLYWNDVPANPSASKQLVNDLDLSVKDPGSVTHLPFILDPSPANVTNNAIERADHTNNAEQIVIAAPAAGVYTVKVKGFNIPSGPQHYVVAYDVIPKGLQLTYPLGGEQVANTDTFRIYWNTVDTGGTFTVLFSADNGSVWTTLSNNIPAGERHWTMMPTGINSGKCLVRIIRNSTGEFATSQRFTINTAPVVRYDADAAAQCPGYINIHWSPVPGATSYLMLRKTGAFMKVVGTATDTAYSFSNMPLNEPSLVAVQPVIDGAPAYRSLATIAIANIGNCSGAVSVGDLMIEKKVSPESGRMYTSTQPGASTVLQVRVRNLYNVPCSNYNLSYSINGGSWVTVSNPGTIPAGGELGLGIPGLSLSAPGTYRITVAIQNLALPDPVPGNDTLAFTVLTIPNDPLDLSSAFLDDFETMGNVTVIRDSVGVAPNGHWDFFSGNDTGRMRSFVRDEVTIGGNRSISLDERMPTQTPGDNMFTGTFNLSNYDTSNTEIRVDFDYMLHGYLRSWAGNVVSARGDDSGGWWPFYTYDAAVYPGIINHVQSLSLTDVLAANNRNFSSSSGISFGQSDISLIGAANFGSGLTIDNFRMYIVANDAALVKVVTPAPANCGLPASVPLTVQVRNGVKYTLYNIQLFYTVDGGPVFTGMIDSLKGKATVDYTFAQQMSTPAGTVHNIKAWLSVAGDTYLANDSILNYRFYNSRVITSFPYLENFEAGDGGYYTVGALSSWQYGTPASPKINKAASGTKAWKTNLAGYYTNQEKSYLYTPCFDISQLANPMLSFSAAMDIENCGETLCDAGYMEYSFDGDVWTKLGAAGQGTNWYDSSLNVWNTLGFTRWHVASIPLPQPPAGQSLHLRFVLSADPGYTLEGIALDDIHVYDLTNPILPANGIVTVTRDLDGNQWSRFISDSKILAAVQPRNQNISNTTIILYPHDTLYNPSATQYTYPRSYVASVPQSPADSAGVRFYLTDEEVARVMSDTSCPSCTRAPDAYRLGITQYDNVQHRNTENGSLADDTGGVFSYYPYRSITWVPYDKGYYAELKAKPFSEFWFNDGGPTGSFPAGIDPVNYVAFRNGPGVGNYWYALIDTAVDKYTVEWSSNGRNFAAVIDTAALHMVPGQYSFNYPVDWAQYPVIYARLKWTLTGKDEVYYSPIRRVEVADSLSALIKLDAHMTGRSNILASWISYIDAMADHYILERAIGDNAFSYIDSETAVKHYGQQYYYTDRFAEHIPAGRLIHYRLTAVLEDGSRIVLPERVVEWANNGSVVNIYPNPTHNGSFDIVWNADAGTAMSLAITDATGRMMYQGTAVSTQWANTFTVRAFNRAKGVYFIRIDIGGNRHSAKIVFE